MKPTSFYILDISVLLQTPEVLYAFPEKEIILPLSILEELDILKPDLGEKGSSAQIICRILDECRQYGNLAEGINLTNGGRLRIELSSPDAKSFPYSLDLKRTANRVLAVAWMLTQEKKNGPYEVVLVSQDENLRAKADALKVSTISYKGHKPDDSTLFSGMRRYRVSKKTLRKLQKQAHFSPEDLSLEQGGSSGPPAATNAAQAGGDREKDFFANEGIFLSSPEISPKAPPENENLLATFNSGKKRFERVSNDQGVWGIRPRNPEQRLALALLLNPQISMVTLSGKSGTGKTLLALAVGLQQMMVENIYLRMLVSRPIFPMGRDLGFLPGDKQEKLAPWMQPIFDNLELLLDDPSTKNGSKRTGSQELMDRGMLVVEPLTYIRGRSIPNQYMVVDEAQNLTPHEMKTIVTRAGEGTKIVLTGDPNQIDNPNVNLSSNGFSTLVERFKNLSAAGHIRFTRGERSQLAELGATVL